MEQPAPTTGMNALMTNAVAVHVLIRLNLMVRLARMAEPAKMVVVLVNIQEEIVVFFKMGCQRGNNKMI